MKKAKCQNPKCNQLISYSFGHNAGGINDKGFIRLKCDKCETVNLLPIQNTETVGGVDAGTILSVEEVDDREEWMKVLEQQPEILEAPNGFPENEGNPDFSIGNMSLWKNDKYDFELQAAFILLQNKYAYSHKLGEAYNYYIKSKIDPKECYIVQDYKIGTYKAKMILAKSISSENDLNADKLYLVHHSRVNLEKSIDGLYVRDDAKFILERLLMRWKLLSNQVIIATPFIGFNYINSIPEVEKLWTWLDTLVNCEKLKFITRRSTYNLLKKSQDTTVLNSSFRSEWNIYDRLVDESERVVNAKKKRDKSFDYDNATVSFVENFHAKFYAGVFDDYVEMLIGSYNIHTGKSWENLSFKRYKKEEFMELYIKKLCPNFKYKDADHNRVLLMRNTHGKEESFGMASMEDVLKEIK